jgi:hypothetical protein
LLGGLPWLPAHHSGPGSQEGFNEEFQGQFCWLSLFSWPPFFQKKKQGRITFDTLDFVAEEVCIGLTFLCRNFLSAPWAWRSTGLGSEKADLGPGSATSPMCHPELAL